MTGNSSTGQEDKEQKQLRFKGIAGRTSKRRAQVGCDCGHTIAAEIYQTVDLSEDNEAFDAFCSGTLFLVRCEACQQVHDVAAPVTFHDPRIPVVVLALPPALRHRELHLTADFLSALAKEACDVPPYAKRPLVAYNRDTLREILTNPPSGDDRRSLSELRGRENRLERREERVLAREEDLLAREEKLVATKDELRIERDSLDAALEELERERTALRALSVDLAARERALRERSKVTPPPTPLDALVEKERKAEETAKVGRLPRPDEEVDRWRASEEHTKAVLHDERVFLLARPGKLLAALREGKPRLIVQLHLVEDLPLVTLALLPADTETDAVFWGLDIRDDGQRAVLSRLKERFEVVVDLYDDESRAVVSWVIEEALEQNVGLVLERAALALEQLGEGAEASFSDVMEAFTGIGEERLGRKQHNFSDESFTDLPSPAAARLALGIVSYWSQPLNEEYLLLVKSFPLLHWRGIQQRVIERCLDVGLRLVPELLDRALTLKLTESPRQYLRVALANFAEVSLRMKPSDLEPRHEWENWRALLADCVAHGVDVEPQIEELAAAAARRAKGEASLEDESAPGGDLGLLSEERLLSLLSEREQRKDAALELCERSTDSVEAIYQALARMTRDEVARVVPAMVGLKGATEAFRRGLAHRKSFVRQGCALALGALGDRRSAEALVQMLLSEPTRIWMEAARALGDLREGALSALLASLERADGEGRERIAWALAHISLLPAGEEAMQDVFAKSTIAGASKAAQRATQMLEFVRRNNAEVRGDKPLSEQTIVRRFSRSFFQGLGGTSVAELTDADIVDQEEELEDADILSAVEDSQDDILREAVKIVADDALEVSDEDIVDAQ